MKRITQNKNTVQLKLCRFKNLMLYSSPNEMEWNEKIDRFRFTCVHCYGQRKTGLFDVGNTHYID